MIRLLAGNPLLLLFVVTAIGYPLGRVRIAGTRLGVASVLFAGLAVGAVDPSLRLPEILYVLGLALFIYTVGLSSAPSFVAAFRRKGIRDNALVAGALVLAGAAATLLGHLLQIAAPIVAGLFCGAATNTPALAAAIETLKQHGGDGDAATVGYSVAYPIGVIGPIVAIALARRIWRSKETGVERDVHGFGAPQRPIQVRTVEVTKPEVTGLRLRDLRHRNGWTVVFTRLQRGGNMSLARAHTRLVLGDRITAVGAPDQIEAVTSALGKESPERLEGDRTTLDYRRVFVSNREIAGRRLGDVEGVLRRRFGAVVTRLRRGDVDMTATPDLMLELGDRVRVLAPRAALGRAAAFFGDSYRAVGEFDVLGFSLGLALGLLIGMIPIPLPGGATLHLGFAGGPLIAGLFLGSRGHTGPLVWRLPYGANLTLGEIGLVMFLAAIGTRAGYAFASTVASAGGLRLLAIGAVLTVVVVLTILWVGHRLFRIPMDVLTGMVSGAQTQPAVLGFAVEQAENDLPHVGYATVYPNATITKIILAQLLAA